MRMYRVHQTVHHRTTKRDEVHHTCTTKLTNLLGKGDSPWWLAIPLVISGATVVHVKDGVGPPSGGSYELPLDEEEK